MNIKSEKSQALLNMKKILFPLILVFFSTCIFYYINADIEEFHHWPTLKFKTGDSTTYLGTGNWLLNKAKFSDVERNVATRPFLYPLILASLESIHPWAVIGFQFFLWVSQILLVYYAALLISRSRIASFILAFFCLSTLSPIGMTLHALTETVSSFLLTSYVVSIFYYVKKDRKNIFLFLGMLSLSLSSVVKPSYLYIFIFNAVLIIFIWRKRSVVLIASILICLLPIFFQYKIMKEKFNLNKISVISTVTINDYFLSYFELKKRGLVKNKDSKYHIGWIRDLRRDYFSNMVKQEGYVASVRKLNNELILNFKLYPYAVISTFFDLICENSVQSSHYLQSKKNNEALYAVISLWQSRILLFINIFSLLLLLQEALWKKRSLLLKKDFFIISLSILSILFFHYISSGVSIGQGDRFLIPIYFISYLCFFYQAVAKLTD
ncbi:MAG: hypothetical protein D3909_03195 [Candidatus Electrothrix sp. ATG1]|nr:hypothetical protein [Candidatus Electrothrix sp. ATG1]